MFDGTDMCGFQVTAVSRHTSLLALPEAKRKRPVSFHCRNRALLVAQTDLVAVLDGDLLPQAGARARFAPGTAVGNEMAAAALRKAYRVLPAFDTADIELAYDIALGMSAVI